MTTDLDNMLLSENQRTVIDRFVATCRADDRIVAAFLGGSYTTRQADQYSDIDLYFITTDEAYGSFLVERKDFVCQLGTPAFLDDFGLPHGYCFIFADGTEGEVWFGCESQFQHIHGGPYALLLDKKDCLAGVEFPMHQAARGAQVDALQQQIDLFWHELAHFIKAMGRRQLWFAYGQLEALRQICVSLARLQVNFLDEYATKEPYFKIEQAMPIDWLSSLRSTFCPLEYAAMLESGLTIFRFYTDVTPRLAEAHEVAYQSTLGALMLDQLEQLRGDSSVRQ